MKQTLTAKAGDCTLEVSASKKTANTLQLAYSFHNQSFQNAYLFNQLYDKRNPARIYETSRNRVYVELEGNPVIVILSKKIAPVPPDKDVEKPVIPCVTLVRAGEQFEVTISLALPLRPWTPYNKPTDSELTASPAERPAYFELGYFLTTPEGDRLAKPVETSEGPALYFYPFPTSSQQLIRVGPLPASVPVRLPK